MISEQDVREYAKKYPATTTEAILQTERGTKHLLNVARQIIEERKSRG